jgi:hypothetical protein
MQRQATFIVWNTSHYTTEKYVTKKQKGVESERNIEEREYKQHKTELFW